MARPARLSATGRCLGGGRAHRGVRGRARWPFAAEAGHVDALGCWLLITWLLTQSKVGLSAYRSEAALLPLAILVGRLPRPLAAVLAGLAVIVAVPMTALYMRNVLI